MRPSGSDIELSDNSSETARRVLVVEDDTMIRDLVVEILESLGHNAAAVDGGAAALDLLETDPAFDLVLCDLTMPGQTGFELAREIKRRLPALAIILSSGNSGLACDAEARLLNLSILRKPYREVDLSRALEAALGAR